MPTTPNQSEVSADSRVAAVMQDYLALLDAGRQPDRNEFIARYPELGDRLSECLDGLELLHRATAEHVHSAGRPGATPIVPSEPLGDFRILREIGRGGMGVVYEATQLSLGRRVALKVLPFAAALDAKQLQRFRTEAHAAAQLHHTNIVPVHAVGFERGTHFYAMQFIEGQSLDAVIRELGGGKHSAEPTVGRLDRSTERSKTAPATGTRSGRGREAYCTAARIAAQIADALQYAHDAGVLHRDIKPANLLLDAKGNVWVTDFGLAQVTAEAGPTLTGDVVGTLRYMSPEQAAGKRSQVDQRADVYSLGATLYELLTLQPIFPGKDRQELLHQILTAEPVRPRQIDRALPVELETIVLKAINKSPEDRYATAGEMASDLRRFLDDRPILARRPTAWDYARKWIRRHPESLAAAVVLLICGVIGLSVAMTLLAREEHRTADAFRREQQRFALAKRLADEMIRIADEEASDDPTQQSLRRRVLEAALGYYQEFIELKRDDPSAKTELESTQARVKEIVADLAMMQAAERHMMLSDANVQADLKLTDEQRDRLQPIFQEINGSIERFGTEEPRLSDRLVKEMKAHENGIAEILTTAQMTRLQQIALQLRGPRVFRDPVVATALNLTPDQRERIRAIESAGRLDHRPGPKGPPPDWDKRDSRPPPPQQEHLASMDIDKALAVLNADQLAKWRELKGEPFVKRDQ